MTKDDEVADLVDTLTAIGVLHSIARSDKLREIEKGAIELTTRLLINKAFNIAAGEELNDPADVGAF